MINYPRKRTRRRNAMLGLAGHLAQLKQPDNVLLLRYRALSGPPTKHLVCSQLSGQALFHVLPVTGCRQAT